jgi:hypothetical protein
VVPAIGKPNGGLEEASSSIAAQQADGQGQDDLLEAMVAERRGPVSFFVPAVRSLPSVQLFELLLHP